jgi:hypothetical protein
MSAFGTKRTSLVAAHMSAIGGKADIASQGCQLQEVLLANKFSSRDKVCKCCLGLCSAADTDHPVRPDNTILACRIGHARRWLHHMHIPAVGNIGHRSTDRDTGHRNQDDHNNIVQRRSPQSPIETHLPTVSMQDSSSCPPFVKRAAPVGRYAALPSSHCALLRLWRRVVLVGARSGH